MTIDELEKKLTELEDLHAELKAQIAELKERGERKPKPPHPRWKPAFPEKYYSIFHNGLPVLENWSGYSNDEREYEIGNIFRTRTEAEFEAERLKVLAEMREWAGDYNDGYSLVYDVGKERVCYVPASERLVYGEMRFTTEEDAEGCIEAVGVDRIKKYYFMIPEEDKSNDT